MGGRGNRREVRKGWREGGEKGRREGGRGKRCDSNNSFT